MTNNFHVLFTIGLVVSMVVVDVVGIVVSMLAVVDRQNSKKRSAEKYCTIILERSDLGILQKLTAAPIIKLPIFKWFKCVAFFIWVAICDGTIRADHF